MAEKTQVKKTQQVSVGASMQNNQQNSVITTNGVIGNNAQTSDEKRQEEHKNENASSWLGRNWGWILAGVSVVGLGVYFLIRQRKKDKDKEKEANKKNENKKFDTKENVDKMFTLAEVSGKEERGSKSGNTNMPLSSISVRQQDGSYVRLNRDGSYKSINYDIVGRRAYYDVNSKAYHTNSSTQDAYKTATSYMADGNIQFRSSSTLEGNKTVIYNATGSTVLSRAETPIHSGNNGTLANNAQRYLDNDNVTGYANGNSR